jgi:hypothetical protein
MAALSGNITARVLFRNLPRKAAPAWYCDLGFLFSVDCRTAVWMLRRSRETAVEITFFTIQNALLPKGYIFCEKIVEIVGLQSEPNPASIGEPGGDE